MEKGMEGEEGRKVRGSKLSSHWRKYRIRKRKNSTLPNRLKPIFYYLLLQDRKLRRIKSYITPTPTTKELIWKWTQSHELFTKETDSLATQIMSFESTLLASMGYVICKLPQPINLCWKLVGSSFPKMENRSHYSNFMFDTMRLKY